MISLLKEKKYFVCCDSLIQLGLMSERVLIVIEDWMLDAIDWLGRQMAECVYVNYEWVSSTLY